MVIAVHGASGYTGRLVLDALRRTRTETVLLGRDTGRLREAAGDAGVPGAELRRARLDTPDELAAALRGCAAVINCAGPFVRLGEPVVRAALDTGTPYLDIGGEQGYVLRVFDAYGSTAKRAGVPVVPMVNDGGFLADLLAHLTAAAGRAADRRPGRGGGRAPRDRGRHHVAWQRAQCTGQPGGVHRRWPHPP